MLNCNSLANFIPSSVLSLFQNTVQWLRYNEGTELTVYGCAREALWSRAQIRERELTPTKRNEQMILSLGELSIPFAPDFFDRLYYKIGESQVIRYTKKEIKKEKDPNIGWDNSCVVSTNEKIFPFTCGLAPCIGILIRAYHRCDLQYPAYLSVTHVYTSKGITEFESSLKMLIKNTHSAGIEIFLCGGWNKEESGKEYVESRQEYVESRHRSNSLYDEILRIVDEHQVRIMQDIVGLADAEGWDGKNSKFDFCIEETGFDSSCNPYAVVGADLITLLTYSPRGSWWWVRPVPKSK